MPARRSRGHCAGICAFPARGRACTLHKNENKTQGGDAERSGNNEEISDSLGTKKGDARRETGAFAGLTPRLAHACELLEGLQLGGKPALNAEARIHVDCGGEDRNLPLVETIFSRQRISQQRISARLNHDLPIGPWEIYEDRRQARRSDQAPGRRAEWIRRNKRRAGAQRKALLAWERQARAAQSATTTRSPDCFRDRPSRPQSNMKATRT